MVSRVIFTVFCLFVSCFYGFSQENETAKNNWKENEKRHTLEVRKALFAATGFFGLKNSFGLPVVSPSRPLPVFSSGERFYINDIYVGYSYKLLKRLSIGIGYLHQIISYRTYDPGEDNINYWENADGWDYYFRVFQFLVSYDLIQRKHFVLRCSVSAGPGVASGKSYRIFQEGFSKRFIIGNIRTFDQDYGDSGGVGNIYLDAVLPITPRYEIGLSLFGRIHDVEDIGGISMVCNFKL